MIHPTYCLLGFRGHAAVATFLRNLDGTERSGLQTFCMQSTPAAVNLFRCGPAQLEGIQGYRSTNPAAQVCIGRNVGGLFLARARCCPPQEQRSTVFGSSDLIRLPTTNRRLAG